MMLNSSAKVEPVKPGVLSDVEDVMNDPANDAYRFYGPDGKGGIYGNIKKFGGHEMGAFDDWRQRFRDDYRRQIYDGANLANNQMRNAASARGFSGSAMRGAHYAGGQNRMQAHLAARDVGTMVGLQEAMERYNAMGRQDQYRAQVEQMQNNWNANKAGFGQSQYAAASAEAQANNARRAQEEAALLGMANSFGLAGMGMIS